MAVEVVRIPDRKSAAFVLAAAKARAAAERHGTVVLEAIADGSRAYLTHLEDGWHIEPATLFDPPVWTSKVLALIIRHGD